MRLDYFYNTEGENFRFYQIPALLLEVKEKFLNKKAELEKEVQQRNSRIQQNENKLKQREISLNQRQEDPRKGGETQQQDFSNPGRLHRKVFGRKAIEPRGNP